MKLNIRIPLIIGAAVLITSAGIGLVELQISSMTLEAAILNALDDKNTSNAELLSATLNGQLDVLGEIATRARVRSMNWEIIQPALKVDVARIGALDLAVAVPEGISHYVTDNTTVNVSDRSYFKRAMAGEKNIELVFSRLSSRIVVLFAVPIFRDDLPDAPVIGALIARKDGGHALSDIVVNLTNSMPSGYSYLVDNDGTFIAHPDTELVTSQFNPITESQTNPSLKPMADMIMTALKERNGVSRYAYEGKKIIGHYDEVPGYPWLLFSSIERRDVDSRLKGMRIVVLTASLAASVFLTVLLTYIGSRSVLISIEEREKITREAIERQAEIEKLMYALKKSSESRTVFLSNISSAMANPINNIIRLSSLLSKYNEIEEDHKKEIETINDEGMKLFDVINDILDILKIESGKLKLKPVKYKLPKFISDITSQYSFLTEDKHIQYRLVVDENLPENLAGDELRIKQICHHLLTNAFKYTHAGSITVSITGKWKNGYVLLVIKIMDTGIGMTEEKINNAFTNYGQGSGGLGLFICKQLAEMMKGTLSITSEYGKGSVFTLCVPQKLLSNETIGADTVKKLAAFKFAG